MRLCPDGPKCPSRRAVAHFLGALAALPRFAGADGFAVPLAAGFVAAGRAPGRAFDGVAVVVQVVCFAPADGGFVGRAFVGLAGAGFAGVVDRAVAGFVFGAGRAFVGFVFAGFAFGAGRAFAGFAFAGFTFAGFVLTERVAVGCVLAGRAAGRAAAGARCGFGAGAGCTPWELCVEWRRSITGGGGGGGVSSMTVMCVVPTGTSVSR